MSYVEWVRGRVGRRKIFLVFASVILRDEHGRILLQHRSDFGVWGLPGGVLELEEDVEACARRELAEETGLTAGALRLVGVYDDPRYDVTYPNGDQVQQFTVCFAGSANGGRLQADGLESRAVAYVEPDQLDSLSIPVWYRDMIRDSERRGGPHFSSPFTADQPLDQIVLMRQFVGQERLIGVGATVAVTRPSGRLLAIRRRDNGDWGLPAGFADLGENTAHAAVREVREETGYNVTLDRILGIYSAPRFHYTYPNGDQVKNVGVFYHARLVDGEATPDPDEVTEIAWMAPGDLLACVSDGYRRYVEPAVRHLDAGYFVE
ncbi:MAG: NUDIX domain-containing protein [Anaerolineae bacterium]